MITNGFAFGLSDLVELDVEFPRSSYIYVGGTAGDIVYLNTLGQAQYLANAGLGYHPIGAKQIVTSADVNGTERTTTATGMVYCSSVRVC